MSRPPISLSENIRPILGAIRTVPIPTRPGPGPLPPEVAPFVTISREPGAGAWTLAQQLVARLNEHPEGEHLWTCWDRELVEKVAADYHLSQELIESLEDTNHSWLTDFLGSLSFSDSQPYADEARIYGRIASTIRALAQTGRVVIVGAGGVFVTRRMPGGIHVRLVAPFEHRVAFMMNQLNSTRKVAEAYIRQREHNRHVFYKRYWPAESLEPHSFTATFNTAVVSMEATVDALIALVRHATVASVPQEVPATT